MNLLPAINIKMKNHNSQFKHDIPSGMEGFGLGIQVFKIESAKNMDANFKSKNRTVIKNIENPVQKNQYKIPTIPKPKRLASLEKSRSQINAKQRLSGYISTKIESGSHNGYTDVIVDRKQPYTESTSIVAPVSYSMRKKVGVSTQKSMTPTQPSKPFQIKQIPNQRIPPTKVTATTAKLNQTAPPEMMYKPQQQYYISYHSQHEKLNRFYLQYQNSQRQCMKQLKQLKKQKQVQMDAETCYRIEYLQSIQGRVQLAIQNMQRQGFQQRNKELMKYDERKSKKMMNNIVPIAGFEMSQIQAFQEDSIQHYFNGDYSGSFKINNFQNVDLAPVTVQLKEEDQDDD